MAGGKGKFADFTVKSGARVRLIPFRNGTPLVSLRLSGFHRDEAQVVMNVDHAELLADALDEFIDQHKDTPFNTEEDVNRVRRAE